MEIGKRMASVSNRHCQVALIGDRKNHARADHEAVEKLKAMIDDLPAISADSDTELMSKTTVKKLLDAVVGNWPIE